MIIKSLITRNGKQLTNMGVVNIDKHTIILADSHNHWLIYKHAIIECDGIHFSKLDQHGNFKSNQVAYLNYWSKNKFTVDFYLTSVSINNFKSTIWNGNNDFVIYLTPERFINKSYIDFIVGPILTE
jgi:sRNA-binding regulator protein Hfq